MPVPLSEAALCAKLLNKAFPRIQSDAVRMFAQPDMIATKSADQTITSNATLAVDNTTNVGVELGLVLAGSAIYTVTGIIPMTIAAAANNVKFDFNGGTATMVNVIGFTRLSLANGTNAVQKISALNTLTDGSTTNAWILAEICLTLETAVGGTFILQTAQSVSGATNTVIQRGSYLSAVRVS